MAANQGLSQIQMKALMLGEEASSIVVAIGFFALEFG
jgi:hypothetical protein